MLHFQHTQYLWFLLLVPLLLALWLLMRHLRSRRLLRFADGSMFGRLIPDDSSWRPAIKVSLCLLALAFLIIAVANPQRGSKMVKG